MVHARQLQAAMKHIVRTSVCHRVYAAHASSLLFVCTLHDREWLLSCNACIHASTWHKNAKSQTTRLKSIVGTGTALFWLRLPALVHLKTMRCNVVRCLPKQEGTRACGSCHCFSVSATRACLLFCRCLQFPVSRPGGYSLGPSPFATDFGFVEDRGPTV